MVIYGCIMGYFMGGLIVALILYTMYYCGKISEEIIFPLCMIWPITFIVWLLSTIVFAVRQLPKIWKM
jgi:hypothetical protein